MNIKVLGTGCKKCKKLEENVREAVQQLTGDYEVEKVEDVKEMMSYNIMSTPALVIDEKVVSTGKVLSPANIQKLLTDR